MPFLSSEGSTYSIEDSTVRYRSSTPQQTLVQPIQPYEDNTYIDWCRESFNMPSSKMFQTRKWLTIIASSICLGYATIFIDLTSVWLSDFKKGLCRSKLDKWSLLDPYSSCPVEDWQNWSDILLNSSGTVSNIFLNLPIYLILALAWVLIVSYITLEKVPLIKQSGIPEIKLIISGLNYRISDYLGIRTLIYKIVGLILVVSSGLWLGKEGPLVHVSCCILNTVYSMFIGKHFDNEAVRRELVSAATATGISVAFNAPIGGVLFVLESMPSFFMPTKIMWNSFISATVAVVVVTGFKAFTDGENFAEKDLFQVNFGNFSWLFVETFPFLILGILGGFYGHFFTQFNIRFSQMALRNKIQTALCHILKLPRHYGTYLELGCLVVVTTLLSFPIEISKLSLNAYLKILFTECPLDNSPDTNSANFMCSTSNGITSLKLLFIIVQGFFLSAYTFGVELPGGILMPSLVLGATSGRLIGIIAQTIQKFLNWDFLATCTEKSCIVSPSSYAVIGAGAYMAGVTKLTMSVVVILFELTGAITYVLPIMLAVVTSKFVNDWLCTKNIYDSWMKTSFNKSNTFNALNEGKGDGLVDFTGLTSSVKYQLPDSSIRSVMVPLAKVKCLCLVPETPYTLEFLAAYISDDNHEGYPFIVSYSNPISLGYINKQHLQEKLSTNYQNPNSIISFQVANLTPSILSIQLHYEQKFGSMLQVELEPETQLIVCNDLNPIVLTLETFEKLHLNYLIILNSSHKHSHVMSGFVDRFILSNLINDSFESVVEDFDIPDETFLDNREERASIELLT